MNLSLVFNRANLKNKSGLYTISIRVNVSGKNDYLNASPGWKKSTWMMISDRSTGLILSR
jgi:hypothetical protein